MDDPFIYTRKEEEIIVREFEKALKDEVAPTLKRIKEGKRHAHIGDGTVHLNTAGHLPKQKEGYYREYVHSGATLKGSPGPERIIIGEGGEIYYYTTHYNRPPIQIK